MSTPLATPDDLAVRYGVTTAQIREWTKRRHWPHLRPGRFVVRYTEAQIAEIDRLCEYIPPKQAVEATGQTARSAARSRS